MKYANTVRCRYNAVNFHPDPYKRHPKARPWRRDMRCFCEYKLWCLFCRNHCRTICKILGFFRPRYNSTRLHINKVIICKYGVSSCYSLTLLISVFFIVPIINTSWRWRCFEYGLTGLNISYFVISWRYSSSILDVTYILCINKPANQ